jgi:hypothetical protein
MGRRVRLRPAPKVADVWHVELSEDGRQDRGLGELSESDRRLTGGVLLGPLQQVEQRRPDLRAVRSQQADAESGPVAYAPVGVGQSADQGGGRDVVVDLLRQGKVGQDEDDLPADVRVRVVLEPQELVEDPPPLLVVVRGQACETVRGAPAQILSGRAYRHRGRRLD